MSQQARKGVAGMFETSLIIAVIFWMGYWIGHTTGRTRQCIDHELDGLREDIERLGQKAKETE